MPSSSSSNNIIGKSFWQAWQAAEESLPLQYQVPRLQEQCGPTALVVMLTPVNVTGALELALIEDAEKKKRPTRISFCVLRMLHAGWSSVPTAAEAALQAKGGGKGGGGGKGATTDRLSEIYAGEHVLAHSYNLNKRGGYSKGARSSECVALSPGMVFTLNVWAKNVAAVFKEQKENVDPFEIGVVQFSMRSLDSEKVEEMIEVRTFQTLSSVSQYARAYIDGVVLPFSLARLTLPKNLAEAETFRARFSEGGHLPNAQELVDTKGLKQSWLRGNLSQTLSLVQVELTSGSFGLGADNMVRYYPSNAVLFLQTLFSQQGAPPCGNIEVVVHLPETHAKNKAWTVDLLNVAILFQTVQLYAIVDTYQSPKQAAEGGGDRAFHSWAKINAASLIAKLAAVFGQNQEPNDTARTDEAVFILSDVPPCHERVVAGSIAALFDADNHKRIMVVPFPESKTHLLVDMRRVVNRLPANDEATSITNSSIVHKDSAWKKGYNAFVFVEGKHVFDFIVCVDVFGELSSAEGVASKRLRAIDMPDISSYCTFDNDDDNDDIAAKPKAKKPEDDEKQNHGDKPPTSAATGGKRKRAPSTQAPEEE